MEEGKVAVRRGVCVCCGGEGGEGKGWRGNGLVAGDRGKKWGEAEEERAREERSGGGSLSLST